MDFVVTWVDDNDPEWREQFEDHRKRTLNDSREVRFRNWDNFQYWFRGIEKFAPWVNKVHFVTWGHLPAWLNVNHPKLNIVKHTDFIPEKYLPTFNSHTIELNLHHLKELSECYVLFNDDVFLIDNVIESMFFVDNKPCDMPIFTAVNPTDFSKIVFNNLIVLNRNFSKKKAFKEDKSKWFNYIYGKANLRNFILNYTFPDHYTGFVNFHITQPLLKSTLALLWKKEYEAMHNSCKNTFRNNDSVNVYLQRYWELASNNFHPVHQYKTGAQYAINNDNISVIVDVIKKQKSSVLCINDVETLIDFKNAKNEIKDALNSILPESSSFEL